MDLQAVLDQAIIDADITSQNAWISSCIDRARDTFEKHAGGIQLLAATWMLPLKTWWGGWSGGVPGIWGLLGLSYGLQVSDGTLRLPRVPLMGSNNDQGLGVNNVVITYYDATDAQQTLAASNYIVRPYLKQPGEIDRAPLAVWPPLSPYRQYPVQVQFTAGYAQTIGSVSGNTITVNGPATYVAGQPVTLSNSGGMLPSPLLTRVTYYVINPTNGGLTFSLAATSGGSAITLTTTGSGTSYVGEIPPNALTAILLMAAHLYRNREPNAESVYLANAVDYYAGLEWCGGYG